jgi:DNA-binding response OmpR family regulator
LIWDKIENMPKKILLIEDDPFLSSLLGNRLKKEGFGVTAVKSGAEASKALDLDKPDLILLDIILPGKSGFEVLEDIRSNPASSKISVIVISNLGQESDIEKAKELGATDYIVKAKITIDDLVNNIKKFLK